MHDRFRILDPDDVKIYRPDAPLSTRIGAAQAAGVAIDTCQTGIQNPGVTIRRIKREPAITETVVAELRAAVLSGALTPGSRVTQEQLAEQMGVSRAPVRQALLLLEREGLVESDRSRGATITLVDPTMILEVYQFRGEIERFVAATLANRSDFDPTPVRTIVSAGTAAVAREDGAQLIELDWRFHTGLYEAVGNRVLIDVMRAQWTHIRRVMGATLAMSDYRRQVWDEHARILDAIVARDSDYAGMLARRHTSEASATLLKRFQRVPEPRDVRPPRKRTASRARVR